jgi:hypothetical protein
VNTPLETKKGNGDESKKVMNKRIAISITQVGL